MEKIASRLQIKESKSIFNKPLKIDFKELFKGLSQGIGHVATGKWEELGNDLVATLGSIGLSTKPEERAFILIQRAFVRALFDLIGEIAGQHLTEVKGSIPDFKEALDSFISQSNIYIDDHFLDRPANISLLKDFSPLLQSWLVLQGIPMVFAQAIAERLPSYFVYALNEEWRRNIKDYQQILDVINTPFSKAGDRELAWLAYSALLTKRIHEGIFDEPFSLSQLYVPLNAYYIEDKGGSRRSEPKRRIVVSLEKELERWLENQDATDAIRVLSGGPGSGKSSFARIFAAKIMQQGKVKTLFVPLHLIDTTKDLVDEVGRFVRDEGVLFENPLELESREQNLFIIFDGLDELSSQGKAAAETARAFVREVERTIERRNHSTARIMVLISGRELIIQENESEFRKFRQILNLLPYFMGKNERRHFRDVEDYEEYEDPNKILNVDFRQEWWKNYALLSGLSFEGLPIELEREDLAEITAQPLLNYLVALSFTRGKIDFNKNINLNIIYSDLVDEVYQRGYERKRTYESIRHMSAEQFSRVLEEIGLATWHGDGRSTTVREIEEHCCENSIGNLFETFQEGAKTGVTRLLAAFFFRQQGHRSSGDPTFVFTHKSFGEYLTAKRIVRATEKIVREIDRKQNNPDDGWDEKTALNHWIKICKRSAISSYLYKFILNEVSIKKVEELRCWQDRLSSLFSYVLRYGMPLDNLQFAHSKDLFFCIKNAEEALLVLLNACARVTNEVSDIRHPEPTTFGAWLKSIQGQHASGENSLALDCLSFLNLNGIYLDMVYLCNANLEYSNLENAQICRSYMKNSNLVKTILTNAIVTGTSLTGADLSGADLSGVDLSKKNLRSTTLTGANLSGADLSGADLTGAILIGTSLTGADLSGVDLSRKDLRNISLSGADLSGAALSTANLSGADLSGADLTGATLIGTDLSGADLTGANLEGINLVGVNLEGANLEKIKISKSTRIRSVYPKSVEKQLRKVVKDII